MGRSLLFALVCAVISLLLLLRRRAAADDDEAIDGDASVIAQLRSAGSDLSKPHEIELFFYFPREDGARSVADALRADGCAVEILAPREGSPQWSCVARRALVLTPERMQSMRAELTALAGRAGGEFDGWGAGVIE